MILANDEAERAVLGVLLMDESYIGKIAGIVSVSDFFVERNAWVYQAILDVASRHNTPDLISVADELERSGKLAAIGGSTYLARALNSVYSTIGAETYAEIVKRASIQRKLLEVAGEIAREASGDKTVGEMVSAVVDKVSGVARLATTGDEHAPSPVSDLIGGVLNEIEHPEDRDILPTGYDVLDKLLNGGFRPGNLVTIAARPGIGKSTFALCVALKTAASGRRVMIFSLEMSKSEIVYRMLSSHSGIDHSRLTSRASLVETEWAALIEASAQLSDMNLLIDDSALCTPSYIEATCRAMGGGFDLVIVDYLGLMRPPAGTEKYGNRAVEVGFITKTMKGLAKQIGAPILLISQLNRESEKRDGGKPRLSDLRESGDIEQDSDAVLMIHRGDITSGDATKNRVATIIVAKHRHGPAGEVQLYFDGPTVSFKEVEVIRKPLNDAVAIPAPLIAAPIIPGESSTVRSSRDAVWLQTAQFEED